jgi:[CysO sulfur-carrier protein]-S-L-cysteine hydrolase
VTIVIPDEIRQQLLEQANAEHPLECCGLLAGVRSGEFLKVTGCYPLVNALRSPIEFASDPADLFRAHKAIRHDGRELLGVYHSHPTSVPIPSRRDLERHHDDNVACVIIGIVECVRQIRAWQIEVSGFREIPIALEPE